MRVFYTPNQPDKPPDERQESLIDEIPNDNTRDPLNSHHHPGCDPRTP
jgi:hypothetical protein